jgi:D-threo-aldose 1-dehydrogenase
MKGGSNPALFMIKARLFAASGIRIMSLSPEQRLPLGKTGLSVSPICFGTSGIGDMPETYGYSVSEERALETVRAIFDSPVNFLDTSRNYGTGRSEERIGRVIRERGGLPKGFVLSTKLDRDFSTNAFDAARAERSLEESLKALNVQQIDLLHLHDPEHARSLDEITAKGGAIDALFKMKERGLAKAVGLAAGKVDVMMPLLRDYPFDALITHNRFTPVNHNASDMMSFAYEKGIAVLNAAPYAGGVFAKGTANYQRYAYQIATDAMLDPVREVEAICARHGVATGPVALQYSMRDPRVTATICGVSRPERVAETIAWASASVPDAVWTELAGVTPTRDDPEATRKYVLG